MSLSSVVPNRAAFKGLTKQQGEGDAVVQGISRGTNDVGKRSESNESNRG